MEDDLDRFAGTLKKGAVPLTSLGNHPSIRNAVRRFGEEIVERDYQVAALDKVVSDR